MLVRDILSSCTEERKIPFSFEFFPPKTEKGWETLFETISKLVELNPAYVSVTYGAGGSTRDNTHQLVSKINSQTGLTVTAHLTCEGSQKSEIESILDSYDKEGVCNILALKGDVPAHVLQGKSGLSEFSYAADLVSYIKNKKPHFGIGVAGFPEGHPAARNRLKEIDFLKAKIDAGADYIVTQMFFDNRDFYDYRERCELAGIKVPIIAGIMPVSTRSGMTRMADLTACVRFPARLLKSIARTSDDEGVAKVGIQYASEQISDLLNNKVAGIQLFTLNNSRSSLEICHNLGLAKFSVSSV